MKNFKIFRILFWAILLAGGFMAGIAWNNGSSKDSIKEEKQLLTETD